MKLYWNKFCNKLVLLGKKVKKLKKTKILINKINFGNLQVEFNTYNKIQTNFLLQIYSSK